MTIFCIFDHHELVRDIYWLTTLEFIPLDQENAPPDEVWGIHTHRSDHVVEGLL